MLNKVMIIGRLGRDPELRYSQSGSPATATVWTVPSGTASWCSRKRRRTAPST